MTEAKTYAGSQGNIHPQTQKEQQLKKEQLAEALRANLRRRKAPPIPKESA